MVQYQPASLQARQHYALAAGYSDGLARDRRISQITWIFLLVMAIGGGSMVVLFALVWGAFTAWYVIHTPISMLQYAVLKPGISVLGFVALLVVLVRVGIPHIRQYRQQRERDRRVGEANAWYLNQYGMITTGVVIDRWSEEHGGGEGATTLLYLAYQYGGYMLKQPVSFTLYRRCGIGAGVQVRYLPNAPAIARLEGEH